MDVFKDFNVTRFEGNLKNGIRVVLFYRAGAPITTRAIITSGSRYDPPEMYGLAHFLEHMVVNGSSQFPAKDLLAEHIESVGGSFGAMTSQDPMWVNTEISDKEDYDRVINIFDATLCRPLMDKKVFENEKKVVVKEIKKSESNPARILTKTVRQLFFKNTPFEHEILGDENSILNLDYKKALSEHKKLFDKSRITFVASGDISSDELINHLNRLTFSDSNQFVLKKDNFLVSDKKNKSANFFDAPETQIFLGIEAPKTFTKESLNLFFTGMVLAGGRNSRLAKKLRYEKGLIYNVDFGRFGGQQFGSWGISTGTAEDKVQEVVDIIMNEIKNLQKDGITQAELDFVKNRKIKSLKRVMQTSNDWVEFHELAEIYSDESYDINKYIKNIKETTVEDIKKTTDQYFLLEKWKLALVGRTKEDSIKL